MKLYFLCCVATLYAQAALSCGMNFSEPRSRIEGCNEQGYVLISEKLAELSIPGEQETVPIWAIFDSSRQIASPYAGMWRIAFLESSLVQLSEDEFQLTDPGGWKRLFRRTGKGTDLLDGGAGWKGLLSSDRAVLWADCGWRIDLNRGKITQLKTPHGQTICYNYVNGRLSSVTCGTKTLIMIEPNDGPDHSVGITIGSQHYSLARVDQPRVQRIGGVNIISGNDFSFHQLNGAKQQTRSFTYSADEQMRPTLTITDASKHETIVSWDPETRKITRYGDWKYDIKAGSDPLANAEIGRTNAKGQREYWFFDGANGCETYRTIEGLTTKTIWFMSGGLAGKIRRVEREENGSMLPGYQAFYDEEGRLIREIGTDILDSIGNNTKRAREIIYKRSPDNNTITAMSGDAILWIKIFKDGKLMSLEQPGDKKITFTYSGKGNWIATIQTANGRKINYTFSDASNIMTLTSSSN